LNSAAVDISGHLAANGIGSFAGNPSHVWSINVAREPVEPANCVTVYDTGGQGPDTDELDIHQPTIQIRVRSKVYIEGYEKQRVIQSVLHSIRQTTIGLTNYLSCVAETDITYIGASDNDFYLFTANYRILRQ
jgi:hypothetical protein